MNASKILFFLEYQNIDFPNISLPKSFQIYLPKSFQISLPKNFQISLPKVIKCLWIFFVFLTMKFLDYWNSENAHFWKFQFVSKIITLSFPTFLRIRKYSYLESFIFLFMFGKLKVVKCIFLSISVCLKWKNFQVLWKVFLSMRTWCLENLKLKNVHFWIFQFVSNKKKRGFSRPSCIRKISNFRH